jgi:hypothetical protein
MATDCHLVYAPVGRLVSLPDLDYVQLNFPPNHLPRLLQQLGQHLWIQCFRPPSPRTRTIQLIAMARGSRCRTLQRPPTSPPLAISPDLITLVDCTRCLNNMTAAELAKLLFKVAVPRASFPSGTQRKRKQLDPIKCMDTSKMIELLHAHDKSPPLVRLSDTPNPLDTKSSWTAEELHCITGC